MFYILYFISIIEMIDDTIKNIYNVEIGIWNFGCRNVVVFGKEFYFYGKMMDG